MKILIMVIALWTNAVFAEQLVPGELIYECGYGPSDDTWINLYKADNSLLIQEQTHFIAEIDFWSDEFAGHKNGKFELLKPQEDSFGRRVLALDGYSERFESFSIYIVNQEGAAYFKFHDQEKNFRRYLDCKSI